jgi:phage terminase large subunit-like protein
MKVKPTTSPGPRRVALMTRGEKVIAFIETYCIVPEGELVGRPMVLDIFQKKFILDVYDNPHGTTLGILSIARKNGKTGLIAGIILAHVCGPEARLNSQICSGAMSRDQAALVFALACKMIQQSAKLQALVRIVPSSKKLIGLNKNVEYRALAADGKTAHGLSPVLIVMDELGQVRGPQSDFIDALITSQGAYSDALQLVISTQAANDADLLSVWIDDALEGIDPKIVCHLHTADIDCELMDEAGWRASNPAMGKFRNADDMRAQAEKASRLPSFEPTFRNLHLNQRVETISPFISRGVWIANSLDPESEVFYAQPVYVGIDLSGKTDLTSMMAVAWDASHTKLHVKSWFWTPEKGLRDRAKRDRAPYDVWAKEGLLRTIPGASIDYEVVAHDIVDALEGMNVVSAAFDRWRFDLLRKELNALGFIKGEEGEPLMPFGQGFKDMAPAIDVLETILLNEQMAHGGHPVLTMCMANARVEMDAAGNRKLNKAKATGRIDGAIALTMAVGVLPNDQELVLPSVYERRGILTL